MALISLNQIAADAEANGFRVNRCLLGRGGRVLEIYAPDHDDSRGGWHNGCQYSGADFIISDRTSYGYNDWFHGPWHDGLTQSDAYGVQKLYEHPAMQRAAA